MVWIACSRGTPDGIRDQLAEAIGQALNSEGVIKALRAQEMEPLQGSPTAFAAHIANEGRRRATDLVIFEP